MNRRTYMTLLKNALEMNHFILKNHIQTNDIVVDATMGNGHDTLFLAQLVGPSGVVHAFDIQETAIHNTTKRLKEAYCFNQCKLHHIGHEHIDKILDDTTKITAATFNLGYLPCADKSITTTPNNTIQAITNILPKLTDNGIVTLVVYHGHEMGKIEKNSIETYLNTLPQQQFTVAKYEFINQTNTPPILIVIEKR